MELTVEEYEQRERFKKVMAEQFKQAEFVAKLKKKGLSIVMHNSKVNLFKASLKTEEKPVSKTNLWKKDMETGQKNTL